MAKHLFRKIALISLFINLLTIILVLLLRKQLPPLVPLFYGLPVSEEQLTPSLGLAIPPVISTLLIAVNYYIVTITKDKFLEKIISGLIIIITTFSLITVLKTIFLIGIF